MTQPSVVVWGARGHSRVLMDLLAETGRRVVAFVDRDPSVVPPDPEVPLLHDLRELCRWLESHETSEPLGFLVAVGGAQGADRRAIHAELVALGLEPAQAVHPTATIARSASLGPGSQALAGSIIGSGAHLGVECIVNTGAQVDHECALAAGVHVAPGAILTGLVDVGYDAMIGAGAVVLPRVRIGDGAVVGAGAVVTEDVLPGRTVVGAPARDIGAAEAKPAAPQTNRRNTPRDD